MLLPKNAAAILLSTLPLFRVQVTNLNIAANHKSTLIDYLEKLQHKLAEDWYHGGMNEHLVDIWDAVKECLNDALSDTEDTPEIANLFYTMESLEVGFADLVEAQKGGLP